MSSAPTLLGFIHWICELKSGKYCSILAFFHCKSSVGRSETLISRADSWIGPIGLELLSNDIHVSFQTFVFWSLPIAFPRFSLSRSLPCRMLLQLCEHTAGSWASRKLFLWQYFPVRTRASKQLGEVNILQATFSKSAWLIIEYLSVLNPLRLLAWLICPRPPNTCFSFLLNDPTRTE